VDVRTPVKDLETPTAAPTTCARAPTPHVPCPPETSGKTV